MKRRWLDAGLTQREMGKYLKIGAAYLTYLERAGSVRQSRP